MLAGRAVRVGAENEYLVLEVGIRAPPSGTAVISREDWLIGDGLAARLGMGGGVFDGSLDQCACGALAERAAGEVVGQFQIEVISAVAVGLAGGGSRLENSDIHGWRL